MTNKYKMTLVGSFLFLLLSAGIAQAIPSLQLYIPGSTYDAVLQSWVTNASNFELQVLGAASPANAEYITNVRLYVAIKENEHGLGGAYLKVNGSPITFGNFGTPVSLPTHGIYPTYYSTYSLPDLMVSTAGEIVHNYNPGESGTAQGDIHYLQIEYGGYSTIHFDAMGTVVASNGNTWERKAPFSHDAEATNPNVVPEPTTMLLLGTGLFGLAGIRRRKLGCVAAK